MATALYEPDGADRYVSTILTQGPWSAEHQFGGGPGALLAHVIEAQPTLTEMRVVRLTIDLLRPIPLAPLVATATIRREGKRVQFVDATLTADGAEVARATAIRLRVGDISDVELPVHPGVGRRPDNVIPYGSPQGVKDPGTGRAMQYACESGKQAFRGAPTWVQLMVPVVEGCETSALERMIYVADCANGFGNAHHLPLSGMNTDICLSIVRPAVGEWVCMTGVGFPNADGIGFADATQYDEHGVVGRVMMTRLIDRK